MHPLLQTSSSCRSALAAILLPLVLTACGGGDGGNSGVAPQITTQPLALTGLVGESVQFSVAASGTPAPAFAWLLDGTTLADGALAAGRCAGATVSGAATATVTLAALPQACDGATLRARASNGSTPDALSNEVTLTVHSRPQVLTAPADLRVAAPAAASFSVQAGGRPAPTIQWQVSTDAGEHWSDVPGATAAQYTIEATSAADNGKRVRAMLSNVHGSTASNAAQLTVDAITPATLTLVAGNLGGPGSVDGSGAAARFYEPAAVARDAAGIVYVADTRNHTIRRITPAGAVDTLAGAAGDRGSSDGIGAAARFDNPMALAVDAAGNIVVADTGNRTIRRITPDGTVSTVAGAAGQSGSADGAAAQARFASPVALAFDAAGRLVVADADNCTLRLVGADGAVSTLSGAAGDCGSTDGPAADARLSFPSALALASDGVLYVADRGNATLRRVAADGALTTLAGVAGEPGTTDGNGSAARLGDVAGLAAGAGGSLWLSEAQNGTLRRCTAAGDVSTVVDYPALGSGDAPRFNRPGGLAADGSGGVLLADSGNHVLRTVTPGGVVGTLAGAAALSGSSDGAGAAARFYAPRGLALDAAGRLLVADTQNHTVRRIAADGSVSTVAGSAGSPGTAQLNAPAAVAADAAGNIYVADVGNHVIRKISAAGAMSVLAGKPGVSGSADGPADAARFFVPYGVAVDGAGNVYVADTGNQLVRRIAPDGTVSTLAGSARAAGSADGAGSAARFNGPSALAFDGSRLWVADRNGRTLRQVTLDGSVSTLAGRAGEAGSSDGPGTLARFAAPEGLAFDAAGNAYVADSGNGTVRRVTPGGVVSTVVGTPGRSGVRLGADGRLAEPMGVAVLGPGRLAIATANGIVRAELP